MVTALPRFGAAEEFLQSDLVNDTACVISDVQMPCVSGVELQSHLIAHGNRTPIIFVGTFSASGGGVNACIATIGFRI